MELFVYFFLPTCTACSMRAGALSLAHLWISSPSMQEVGLQEGLNALRQTDFASLHSLLSVNSSWCLIFIPGPHRSVCISSLALCCDREQIPCRPLLTFSPITPLRALMHTLLCNYKSWRLILLLCWRSHTPQWGKKIKKNKIIWRFHLKFW